MQRHRHQAFIGILNGVESLRSADGQGRDHVILDNSATSTSIAKVAGLARAPPSASAFDFMSTSCNAPRFWDTARAAPEAWPTIGGKPHEDHENAQPEQLLELTEMMLDRGYGEDDVRGILGANFLRLARAVWI